MFGQGQWLKPLQMLWLAELSKAVLGLACEINPFKQKLEMAPRAGLEPATQ